MKKIFFVLAVTTLSGCSVLDEFPSAPSAQKISQKSRLRIAQEVMNETMAKGNRFIVSNFDPPACSEFKQYFAPMGYKIEDLPGNACKISW